MGYTFEQIAKIIELIDDKNRIGVCLDTCHTFVAGYDLRTKKAYKKTMKLFEEIIGFAFLKGIHLNDSKKELGSKVDRHENIGKGKIGLEAFKFIMNDNRLDEIPMILETPVFDIWKDEISLLYKLKENK